MNRVTSTKHKLNQLAERLLGERLLADFKKYADPAHQIEVKIHPITNPVHRIVAIVIGSACVVVGIPAAAILPIVPIAPFAAVGLMCFARVSPRFQRWLLQQLAYRITVTVIYTRNERPFRLLRQCFNALAGQPAFNI